MRSTRVLSLGAVGLGFLLGMLWSRPRRHAAHAAWSEATGAIAVPGRGRVPIPCRWPGNHHARPNDRWQHPAPRDHVRRPHMWFARRDLSWPSSHGSKLAGIDGVLNPPRGAGRELPRQRDHLRARLNFVNPADGTVVRQITTTDGTATPLVVVPSNGWAHLAHRQDKGDLLGCGNNVATALSTASTSARPPAPRSMAKRRR